MRSVSGETLLAGLASGEPEPATAFVRRFQARVYCLAFAIVGDPQPAEEVAQETFLRAWRHAATHDPRRAPVATWLLTIVRNLAVDACRLRNATPIDPDVLHTLPITSTDVGPEDRPADRRVHPDGDGGVHALAVQQRHEGLVVEARVGAEGD